MDSVRESEEYKRRSSSVRRSNASKERSKRLTAFQARFKPTTEDVRLYNEQYGNILDLVAKEKTAVNVNKATRKPVPPTRQTVKLEQLTQTLPRMTLAPSLLTMRRTRKTTLNPRTTKAVDEYRGGKEKGKVTNKDKVKDKKSKPLKNIK